MEIVSQKFYALLKKPKVMEALVWLGRLLSAVSMVFVGFLLFEYRGQISPELLPRGTILLLVGLGAVYGALNILMALAWHEILLFFKVSAAKITTLKIYSLSQLAKYIPGNVFHLFGRQGMSLSYGIPGWPVAKSMPMELLLQCLCGLMFVALAAPLAFNVTELQSIAFFLTIATTTLFALGRLASPHLAWAFAFQLIFLAGASFSFAILISFIHGAPATVGLTQIMAAYTIAWLVGIVTPGAPAALGVREVMLIFLIGPFTPESTIVLTVLLGRVITVSGDLLFYLGGLWLAPPPKRCK